MQLTMAIEKVRARFSREPDLRFPRARAFPAAHPVLLGNPPMRVRSDAGADARGATRPRSTEERAAEVRAVRDRVSSVSYTL